MPGVLLVTWTPGGIFVANEQLKILQLRTLGVVLNGSASAADVHLIQYGMFLQ